MIGASPVIGGTTGSVLFVGSGPVLAEDNTRFFWDNIGKSLIIGATTHGTVYGFSHFVSGSSNLVGTASIASRSNTVIGNVNQPKGHLNTFVGAFNVDSAATLATASHVATLIGAGNIVSLGSTIGLFQVSGTTGVTLILDSSYGDVTTSIPPAFQRILIFNSDFSQSFRTDPNTPSFSGGSTRIQTTFGFGGITPAWVLTSDGGTAIGAMNTVSRAACAIGYLNVASGYGSFAQGVSCTASGDNSFASGYIGQATGTRSFVAGGYSNSASGTDSFVAGQSCQSNGDQCFAGGLASTTGVGAASCFAFGSSCAVSAGSQRSFSIGSGSGVNGDYNFGFSSGITGNNNFGFNANIGSSGCFVTTDGSEGSGSGGGKALNYGSTNARWVGRYARGYYFGSGIGVSSADTNGASFGVEFGAVELADAALAVIQSTAYPYPVATARPACSFVRTIITAVRTGGDNGSDGDGGTWEFTYRVKTPTDNSNTSVTDLDLVSIKGDAAFLAAMVTPSVATSDESVQWTVQGGIDWNTAWNCETRIDCNTVAFFD